MCCPWFRATGPRKSIVCGKVRLVRLQRGFRNSIASLLGGSCRSNLDIFHTSNRDRAQHAMSPALRGLAGSVLSSFRSIDIKSFDPVIEVPHPPENEHISHGFAMRFFPFWILAFESAMITSSAAYTYWVDASCSNRNDWNAYLTEALDMAKKANTRLRRNPDSDYANVFKRVFKVDKTDNKAFDTVTGNSNSILYTTRPWILIP